MPKGADFSRLAWNAYSEFEDVADYIWKAPRLIEHEFKLEVPKLAAYFPLTGNPEHDANSKKLRRVRWHLEGKKLNQVFPYLIATGNLFSSVALFETWNLILCKELEKMKKIKISESSGDGISRLRKFMSRAGIDFTKAPLRHQIDAIFKIRNCLFHASGLLAWSRQESELRTIVKNASYLANEVKSNKKNEKPLDELRIVKSPLGEQLQITNDFSHIATVYLRDHFVGLCKQAQFVCDEEGGNFPPPIVYLHQMK
jgi:hypothetical protein